MHKMEEEKNIIVIICAKNPNKYLLENISNLYSIQITNKYEYKIICVDSDSDNFETYEIVKKSYPLVEIHMVKNKNYEYGAYKYAYNKYPNYDIYICIQDTFIINKKIDVSCVNDSHCWTYPYKNGFWDKRAELDGIKLLKEANLEWKKSKSFRLAQHCSFIVSQKVMCDICKTFKYLPIDKHNSCLYERLFGIYFTIKKINVMPLKGYVRKYHGKRGLPGLPQQRAQWLKEWQEGKSWTVKNGWRK